MIPMEYEWRRHCSTSLGWNDPRGLDADGIPLLENGLPRDAEAAVELDDRNGTLMWPERFEVPKEVEAIPKPGLGPYMASGRLQQSPQPKGGLQDLQGRVVASLGRNAFPGHRSGEVAYRSIARLQRSRRTIPRR